MSKCNQKTCRTISSVNCKIPALKDPFKVFKLKTCQYNNKSDSHTISDLVGLLGVPYLRIRPKTDMLGLA